MQKVEEYETFNKTNVIDTTGTGNQENNELNKETDPEKKEEIESKDGDIDPSILQKELEKNELRERVKSLVQLAHTWLLEKTKEEKKK